MVQFKLNEFVEKCQKMGFNNEISLKNIRSILSNEFGVSSVMYPVGKVFLKNFIENLESYGFGTYNNVTQIFSFIEKTKGAEK